MNDGSRLAFRVIPPIITGADTHAALLSTSAMALGIVVLAGVLMHRVTAPLRRLVFAADAIGRTADPVLVLETGPDEIRNVALAFNAMQMRIQRLVEDRTQALAAVSHDLRTPITRLRLRAGFIDDPMTQKHIDADLDEMEAMINATLAHLSGSQETEARRPTDVPALLATLVDDASDAGHQASYEGPAHAAAVVRPIALKRALGNLIHNAILYGGSARVKLATTSDGMDIAVEDDGPGIPPAELDRVFEPFTRLEPSRNRSTGGVGLGLTIARQAILTEGGTLWLENRRGGGLTAHVAIQRVNRAEFSGGCNS
jgi:signal transduction histidine kinase